MLRVTHIPLSQRPRADDAAWRWTADAFELTSGAARGNLMQPYRPVRPIFVRSIFGKVRVLATFLCFLNHADDKRAFYVQKVAFDYLNKFNLLQQSQVFRNKT